MDDYKVLYQKIVWELEDDVRAYLTKGYKTAGGVGQVKTGWFSWASIGAASDWYFHFPPNGLKSPASSRSASANLSLIFSPEF